MNGYGYEVQWPGGLACPECAMDEHDERRHDPQCMTGRLVDIEVAARRLRRLIADGSTPRAAYRETVALLTRRMAACVIELETRHGAADGWRP